MLLVSNVMLPEVPDFLKANSIGKYAFRFEYIWLFHTFIFPFFRSLLDAIYRSQFLRKIAYCEKVRRYELFFKDILKCVLDNYFQNISFKLSICPIANYWLYRQIVKLSTAAFALKRNVNAFEPRIWDKKRRGKKLEVMQNKWFSNKRGCVCVCVSEWVQGKECKRERERERKLDR